MKKENREFSEPRAEESGPGIFGNEEAARNGIALHR
jgi:hypothetical protein